MDREKETQRRNLYRNPFKSTLILEVGDSSQSTSTQSPSRTTASMNIPNSQSPPLAQVRTKELKVPTFKKNTKSKKKKTSGVGRVVTYSAPQGNRSDTTNSPKASRQIPSFSSNALAHQKTLPKKSCKHNVVSKNLLTQSLKRSCCIATDLIPASAPTNPISIISTPRTPTKPQQFNPVIATTPNTPVIHRTPVRQPIDNLLVSAVPRYSDNIPKTPTKPRRYIPTMPTTPKTPTKPHRTTPSLPTTPKTPIIRRPNEALFKPCTTPNRHQRRPEVQHYLQSNIPQTPKRGGVKNGRVMKRHKNMNTSTPKFMKLKALNASQKSFTEQHEILRYQYLTKSPSISGIVPNTPPQHPVPPKKSKVYDFPVSPIRLDKGLPRLKDKRNMDKKKFVKQAVIHTMRKVLIEIAEFRKRRQRLFT
ncbi:mucin-2 isoform X2 [Patella vulgata]|nr:mucin-2 isoform X2 [Patella vulgata]XP_050397048.1 mucin-2 isoform X2 [Patella vulgata]